MLPQMRSINLPVVNDRTDPAQRERLTASLPETYAVVLREAKPDAAIAERVPAYAALAPPKPDPPVGRIPGGFSPSSHLRPARRAGARGAARGRADPSSVRLPRDREQLSRRRRRRIRGIDGRRVALRRRAGHRRADRLPGRRRPRAHARAAHKTATLMTQRP